MANHFKLVNLWQSKEDRRAKYWLCRSLGMNAAWSRHMMDWRLSKIERLFNLDRSNKFEPELIRAQAHFDLLPQNPGLNSKAIH